MLSCIWVEGERGEVMVGTRGKMKIQCVIKTWNVCVCVQLGRSMFPWGKAQTLQRPGGTHPGNVTELAAVRRARSFLVVNKSVIEMRCSEREEQHKHEWRLKNKVELAGVVF